MGKMVKFPGDTVTCRFTAKNLSETPMRLRAKIDVDGYIGEQWEMLDMLQGDSEQLFVLTRTVRDFSTTHKNEDATLTVETAAGLRLFKEKKDDLFDMLPLSEAVVVTPEWGALPIEQQLASIMEYLEVAMVWRAGTYLHYGPRDATSDLREIHGGEIVAIKVTKQCTIIYGVYRRGLPVGQSSFEWPDAV